jgi:activating signal cointegrator 1
MKALTLTQPWAQLVIEGRKQLETRSWQCGYRGGLAIHAAKGMPADARAAAVEFGYDPDALPRMAILGHVTMLGCVPTHLVRYDISDEERSFGDYTTGRYAFRLAHPERYPEPVPVRGALGLWDWEPLPAMPSDDEGDL